MGGNTSGSCSGCIAKLLVLQLIVVILVVGLGFGSATSAYVSRLGGSLLAWTGPDVEARGAPVEAQGSVAEGLAAPAANGETVCHVVQRGDTLSGLAGRFDTTVEAIKSANGLCSNTILIGQTLQIPSCRVVCQPTCPPVVCEPSPEVKVVAVPVCTPTPQPTSPPPTCVPVCPPVVVCQPTCPPPTAAPVVCPPIQCEPVCPPVVVCPPVQCVPVCPPVQCVPVCPQPVDP